MTKPYKRHPDAEFIWMLAGVRAFNFEKQKGNMNRARLEALAVSESVAKLVKITKALSLAKTLYFPHLRVLLPALLESVRACRRLEVQPLRAKNDKRNSGRCHTGSWDAIIASIEAYLRDVKRVERQPLVGKELLCATIPCPLCGLQTPQKI